LNPLVSLTAIPTLSPFVRDQTINSAELDDEAEMVAFLKRERVDVVVACDMTRKELVSDSHPLSYGARASHPYQMKHDGAARKAGAMFYGAGTYGFHGYVFADLGPSFELVVK
jgi:ubiquitin-like 1-activating enzyme E1 A